MGGPNSNARGTPSCFFFAAGIDSLILLVVFSCDKISYWEFIYIYIYIGPDHVFFFFFFSAAAGITCLNLLLVFSRVKISLYI